MKRGLNMRGGLIIKPNKISKISMASGNIFREITSWKNLETVFNQEYKNLTPQHKRDRDVLDFKTHFKQRIKTLSFNLQNSSYRPSSVKYFFLFPKKRKIALINFRDRIVQRAVLNVLRPKLEIIFSPCCYAFRPNNSVQEVQKRVLQLINNYPVGVKLDIKSFFDSISHKRLLCILQQYVHCSQTIRLLQILIKQGGPRKGILQGSCLSPLLSNIYLTPFDKQMSKNRHYFRYCDDLLLLTDSKTKAQGGLNYMKGNLERDYGLTIKREKTHIFDIYHGFSFLGVFFRKEPTA